MEVTKPDPSRSWKSKYPNMEVTEYRSIPRLEIKTSQYTDVGKQINPNMWEKVESWANEPGMNVGNDLGILLYHKIGNCSTDHILGNHIGN
jgi:hypothetical protein